MTPPAKDPMLWLPASICSGQERDTLLKIVRRRRMTPMVRQVWEASGDGALLRPPLEWAKPLRDCVPGQSMAPWRDRWLACWLLGRMELGGESRSEVVAALSGALDEKVGLTDPLERNTYWRGLLRCYAPGLALSLLLGVVVMVAVALGSSSITWSSVGMGAIVGGSVAILGSFALAAALTPIVVPASVLGDLRVREAAAVALGRISTIDCIPALAHAALGPHRATRRAATEALLRMLPDLPAAAYPEHSADVSPALLRLLRHSDDVMVVTSLSAIEKVGDGSCVGDLQKCADAGRTEDIRQRSAELLPILRARREQERQAATLLRPAEPDAASALLRPAADSPTDPALLLRAAPGEDADAAR